MYARIENNIAVEYPLYEGDLQRRFPNLQFPMDTHGTQIPDGYARVYPGYVENPDYNFSYKEVMPVLVDGKFVQHWDVTVLTDEEKQNKLLSVGTRVRASRDQLLQTSDVLVTADRWESYSAEKKTALSTYRQTLRDIPSQEGFPYSITWPTLPV
jgi:hypothetical protein